MFMDKFPVIQAVLLEFTTENSQKFLTYTKKHTIIKEREKSSVFLKIIMCLLPSGLLRSFSCKVKILK